MQDKNIKRFFLFENATIKDAMELIQKEAFGIAVVVDLKGHLSGTLTDGDIRRAILRGKDVSCPVKLIMNTRPITAKPGLSLDALKDIMMHKCVTAIPIVDNENHVVDLAHIIKTKPGQNCDIHSFDTQINKPVKNVLVIGGVGYLGSHLVRLLLQHNYNVRVLDNLLYTKQSLEDIINHPKLEFIEGDIRNIETLLGAIKGIDAVIHLAAIVGDPACNIDPEFTIDVNYTATRTIAEVVLHHSIHRFIFTSSCSVYGAGLGVFREDSRLNPLSLYAKTKFESERAILGLMSSSFSPTILRLATLYGLSKRMRFDLVINKLTSMAVTEGSISVFCGKQWRPHVHVYDAARAFLLVLQAPLEKVGGQIFNVGSNEQTLQVIQLANIIKELMPEVAISIDDKDSDKRDYNVSFDKINNILNFVPQKTIRDGISEIKEAIGKGHIADYRDKIYHNYNYLNELLRSCE